jgi:D-serine deaminase-like pyridoxal phosphate-dependent protein
VTRTTASAASSQLQDLQTPCLVLDATRMDRNIDRLRGRLRRLGVRLNPHLKTAKCVEVAQRLMESPQGPCTVSTLQEAEQFAAAGVRNVLYAVGIAPNKLARALALRAQGIDKGIDLVIVLDSVEQAHAVVEAARAAKTSIPVLIEIDTDGHRSGVKPDDAQLLTQIARAVHDGGSEIRGVLAHAGDSYNRRGEDALIAIAEQERAGAVAAASILRAGGWACPVVSVGSSPTAHFARDLSGVTEVRAGVFVFFDLVMAGIGVCSIDDIALSVLANVIGHQRERGWILIDAGWMAMSRDRGTAKQEVDQGYGLVCDVSGRPYADLIVVDANQEHGIIGVRPSSGAALPDLPIGTLVRILPNHACATGAQHDRYHVVRGESSQVHATWNRFRGW